MSSASGRPLRAVVFDLFDTLVDLHMEALAPVEHAGRRLSGTFPALHAALERRTGIAKDRFAEVLSDVDHGFRESRYAKGLELPTDERFAAVLEALEVEDEGLRAELTATHMAGLKEQVRALDHHPELLAGLRAQGLRVALCSNFSHSQTALAVLEESGLHAHLDSIVVSDAVGIRKPRPEIFRAVLDELGVAPEETLHVGDNLAADVGGAAALGITTAWVVRRVRDPDARLQKHLEAGGPAPDHRVADLAELVEVVAARG